VSRSPIAAGIALAAAAAIAFGVTLPIVSVAGAGLGPYTTAALLYCGAAAVSAGLRLFSRDEGRPLGRDSIRPLAVMAIAGAAAAPALFAWGLQRAGPVTSGLLLNLEAAWTALLAWRVYREALGVRAGLALVLMTAGGALLVLRGGGVLEASAAGALAVAAASLAWAVDNTASRRVAELPPLAVVAVKGLAGAALTLPVALALHEPLPGAGQAAALLLAGATGYGVSLRLYLLAQRRVGAARTASVFALAPFAGAALGWLVQRPALSWELGVSALLFAAGVALHLSERHHHRHLHEAVEHEHPHRHDDGHHDHLHAESVTGEHSHAHRHAALEHAHEHAPDVHHGHAH